LHLWGWRWWLGASHRVNSGGRCHRGAWLRSSDSDGLGGVGGDRVRSDDRLRLGFGGLRIGSPAECIGCATKETTKKRTFAGLLENGPKVDRTLEAGVDLRLLSGGCLCAGLHELGSATDRGAFSRAAKNATSGLCTACADATSDLAFWADHTGDSTKREEDGGLVPRHDSGELLARVSLTEAAGT
jgi:hypothetical protein